MVTAVQFYFAGNLYDGFNGGTFSHILHLGIQNFIDLMQGNFIGGKNQQASKQETKDRCSPNQSFFQ